MALAAAHGQAEPDRPRRVDAIDDRADAKLILIDAAFGVERRVAMEAGRQPLLKRRLAEQVPGQLLDRELVERQVAIDGVNDPVPIAPGLRPWLVIVVAVRVGI